MLAQTVLPPTPRLELVGILDFPKTQNQPGLKKDVLPHPCRWQVHGDGVEEGSP